MMNDTALSVADNLVVSLEYVLRLDDGEVVDQTDSREPVQFLQGAGEIISGLEQALVGMYVGDEKKVVIAPEEGYGEYDPENYVTMPRSAFPNDLEMREGTQLALSDSETDEVFEAYVAELKADEVILDLNHPLAGEKLHFSVKIAGLRQATADELDHGHVHDGNHAH
jgi:FKBP-type peptidyl-prolyl cis-trans isomerase SlyD